jgi:deoxyribodipyrimidine photo-lyase
MSTRRVQFLLEALTDLKAGLESRGSSLIVRVGRAEDIIPELVREFAIDEVLIHEEVCYEELKEEDRVKKSLPKRTVFRSFWGSTLFHIDDLPMKIPRLPEVFTQFRRSIEGKVNPRPPLPTPSTFPALPERCSATAIPSLEALGLSPPSTDTRAQFTFKGGMTAGMQRVEQWMWRDNCLQNYKDTRNGMVGQNYSSRLAPWLSLGCISPRWVQAEIERYESTRVKNESTYWLTFELLWRDYFRFWSLKHGNAIFLIGGPKGRVYEWKNDDAVFEAWISGRTGESLVDACMNELRETGWMSNRGRQNAASYWAKTLGQDWRRGAAWFEYHLIDYDVCSNWGNWTYVAGVGNDPRDRVFNVPSQAKKYDPDRSYRRLWSR